MRHVALFGVWLLTHAVIFETAFGADLTASRKAYDDALLVIELDHADKTTSFDAKYMVALSNLLARATNAGSLDTVKAVIAESERFAKEKTVPAGGSTGPIPELRTLQAAFSREARLCEKAKAQAVVMAVGRYEKDLVQLQSDLARQGKADEAARVREERMRLEQRPELLEARRVLVPGTPPDAGMASTGRPKLASSADRTSTPANLKGIGPKELILRPADAQVRGDIRRAEKIFDFWIKGEVSWKDVTVQAGTYKVSLSYASPGDQGGEFTVAIGDNELKGETRPTGGFSRYDNVAIGSVTLPSTTLVVRVSGQARRQWLMNLRFVKLRRE